METVIGTTREAAEDTRPPRPQKIRIEQHSAVGMLWFAGWLFAIGFLHLPLGKALLGIVLWPYYLGSTLSGLLG